MSFQRKLTVVANGVTTRALGRVRMILLALAVCVFAPALLGFVAGSASPRPGTLDGSFGAGGRAKVDFAGTVDTGLAMALRPNGKIVLAGATSPTMNADNDIGVAQLNPTGALDDSFGVGGHTAADFGADEFATAVALQRDGKIVAAGRASRGVTGRDFAVARISTKGLYDSSFGTGGRVTIDFGATDQASALALRPNGKIVVVGYTVKGAVEDFAVAQLTQNGTLDSAFGANGHTAVDFGGVEDASAMAVQRDGKIVVVGSTTVGATRDFAVARINPNGTLDRSFGARGKLTVDFGDDDEASGIALRPDGRIVVAGNTTSVTHGRDFAVARINRDGTLDGSFGVSGKSTVDFGGLAVALALVLRPDGRIVLAGSARKGTDGSDDFAVAQVTRNGRLDRSFGAGGKVKVDFGGSENAYAITLQRDGKIVVAGSTNKGTNVYDFAVARLRGPR